jgi:PAS domain S-box-containing protein
MTTVLYLGRGDDEVVSDLRQAASGFDVQHAEPRTMVGCPDVDCLVVAVDSRLGGTPVATLARTQGYRGPIVLFDRGSHEELTARCEAVGATTYVRRQDAATAPERLAAAIGRVVAHAARADGRAREAETLARSLATADDEDAVSGALVETVERAGGAAAVVATARDSDERDVLAATDGFDTDRLREPAVVVRADESTTGGAADGRPWTDAAGGDGVVALPMGDAWQFVVDGEAVRTSGIETLRQWVRLGAVALEQAARLRQLRQEYDRFASLYDNTSDAIVDIDYVDGEPRIRDVNPSFEALFGYERDAVVGQNLDELVVPTGEETGVEASWRRREGEGTAETEVRRVTADGVRDFLLRSVPFGNEETTRGYVIYMDITDRKRTERVLGQLHETTRKLMQAADEDDIAAITTAAATDILGYPVTTIRLDDPATETLRLAAVSDETETVLGERPESGPEVDLARNAFETGTPRVIDDLAAHGVTDVGIERAMYLPLGGHGLLTLGSPVASEFSESDRRLAQILAANVTVALARMVRIRTLQRREDELARQNERLESFASVVSHDLRNPLSVARGYLDLAREAATEGAEDPTPHFERVENAHGRMNRLITDLLALAREGQSVGRTEAVDIGPTARRAWEAVETTDAVLDVGDDRTIAADGERLASLFENLFRNSVEHGSTSSRPEADDAVEHGSRERKTETEAEEAVCRSSVHVRVGLLDDSDGFFVADDGPGIPPDERDAVFERGYTTGESGTGFGLSIVRGIAEAHGWTVEATESESGGARFEVRGVEPARENTEDGSAAGS